MPTVDYDQMFKDADRSGPGGLIEPGDYPAVPVTATGDKPTQTGKPMIKVKYKVDAGPAAGTTLYNQYVISPESPVALGIFLRDMSAHGITEDYLRTNPSTEDVAERIMSIGARVMLTVDHSTYRQKLQNNVQYVNPAAGGQGASFAPPPPVASVPAPVPSGPTSTSTAPPTGTHTVSVTPPPPPAPPPAPPADSEPPF